MNEQSPIPERVLREHDFGYYLDLFSLSQESLDDLRIIKGILEPNIDVLLDEFYELMLSKPETREIIQSPEMIENAMLAQRHHWLDWVFSGKLNEDYIERCRRIGRVHLNHKVHPQYYLFAYQFLQRQIRRLILVAMDHSPERTRIVDSLEKAIFLDMSLALSVYCDEMSKLWRESSQRDFLTNLTNRRGLEEQFSIHLEQARRHHRPISIALMDLDHFKKVNDTFGHDFGDEVLVITADQISTSIRASDLAGRWGGEDFLLMLPETDIDQAKTICDRIRRKIEATEINQQGQKTSVTISIGLASWQLEEKNLEPAIQRADQALYQAKENGRNRISVSQA